MCLRGQWAATKDEKKGAALNARKKEASE